MGGPGANQPPLWSAPDPAQAAAPPPEQRRNGARLGAVVLVFALLVGLVTWLLWPNEHREPFDRAVANLGAATALHYRTSEHAGQSTSDVRVTSHGDAAGTTTDTGRRLRTLQVGAERFVRSADGLPAAAGLPAPLLKDRWVTGSAALGGVGTQQVPTPRQLADALRAALADTSAFPPADAPGTSVAGVAALKASTPAGDLYVTRDAPYRVLRYVPASATGKPAAPSLPSFPALGSGPSAESDGPPGADPDPERLLRDLGTLDVDPMSPADIGGLYDELEADVTQLGDAVDTDVHVQLAGKLHLSCASAGCTVTADVRNATPRDAVGGTLDAVLTATVAVDGEPAGPCTNRAVLPVSGGTITCENAAAGTVWSAAQARKSAAAQAEADARAAAQRGTLVRVPFQVLSTTQGIVYATPQVDIDRERDRLHRQRTEATCPPTSRPGC